MYRDVTTIISEIYLDNAATTKPCAAAIEACICTMEHEYGNPSSLHKKGWHAEQLITKTKQIISRRIGCHPDEIIFTSGATESNNLAIAGIVNANKRKGSKIVTTEIEHPSVNEPINFLASKGYTIEYVKPNSNGEYDPADFFDAVDDKTILVSCMQVNNETGLILPVEAIADAVKRKNPTAIMHVDGVQSFLKLPIKLKKSNIDCMSFSGHKVYAPKGIGALYLKKGVHLTPLLLGGAQQCGMRAGTESVPLIAAFGAAVENVDTLSHPYADFKQHLITQLADVPTVVINSHEGCAPHIVNLSILGIRSEIMLHFLEQDNIYVSSGSACSKGKKNHVFAALSTKREVADSAIRVSFGIQTTFDELDKLVEKIIEGIAVLHS